MFCFRTYFTAYVLALAYGYSKFVDSFKEPLPKTACLQSGSMVALAAKFLDAGSGRAEANHCEHWLFRVPLVSRNGA